jgi:hypothetical protein
MKLNFPRVHSLLFIGTLAAAIAHPLVAQALTINPIFPPNHIITQQPDSLDITNNYCRAGSLPTFPRLFGKCLLIKEISNIYAQTTDNPPRDESTGGSR